jgi:hypothetical protein
MRVHDFVPPDAGLQENTFSRTKRRWHSSNWIHIHYKKPDLPYPFVEPNLTFPGALLRRNKNLIVRRPVATKSKGEVKCRSILLIGQTKKHIIFQETGMGG